MPKEGTPPFRSCCDMKRLVAQVCDIVTNTASQDHKESVQNVMQRVLGAIELDDFSGIQANQRGYRRKMIYSDPNGYFSILQIKWQPGAETPVHGHKAWGCVGVVSGEISCETFERCDDHESGTKSTGVISATKGAIATVDPDPQGIHRLFNASGKPATTLHIYGMDLSANPCAINVPYGKPSHGHT